MAAISEKERAMDDNKLDSVNADTTAPSNNLPSAVYTQDSTAAKVLTDGETRSKVAAYRNISKLELVLIPLHPATRKQKLEAKQLPIVLGRTNVAAWWWKSCPCQHYCRLHCRPVAQNIRSLSKVMIQIDTAGRVHLVGKNRHLVTITPERDDNQLHVNDILSIGRPDREPWMRFQVIQKSMCEMFDTSFPKPKSASLRSIPIASPTAINESFHASVRPSMDSNKHSHKPLLNDSNGNKLATKLSSPESATNPPEWITTTSRKRKSLARSSSLCSMDAGVLSSNASKRHSLRTSIPHFVENRGRAFGPASAMPTTSRFQRTSLYPTFNNTGNVSPSRSSNTKTRKSTSTPEETPFRKRRRRDKSAVEGPLQKSSRRNVRVGGIRDNRTIGKDINERSSRGAATTANGDSSHRAHVHFVFQDYQTSACLLRESERKRKSESFISKAPSIATSTKSKPAKTGSGQPFRKFISDKNQLRISTENFAAAFVDTVSKTNEDVGRSLKKETPKNDEKTFAQISPGISKRLIHSAAIETVVDKAMPTNNLLLSPAKSHVSPSSKRSQWFLSSSEEYKDAKEDMKERKKATENTRDWTRNLDAVAGSNQSSSPNGRDMEASNAQESLLNLLQGTASSLESGQRDCILRGPDSPYEHATHNERAIPPSIVASITEKTEGASSTSQPTVNPIM